MLIDLALPIALATHGHSVTLRRATEGDLPGIVAMLADDAVSAARADQADGGDPGTYRTALLEVLQNASNDLLMAVDADDVPVGTLQLTRVPSMARRGTTRLLVEAVRVRRDARSAGVGSAMMRWVTAEAAPALGAALVQLTSDEARTDAHRFYERLGFVGSHRGFKFRLG